LFEPWALRGVTARNRVVVSPMCQYSAVGGLPQPWHTVHLGGLATGGAGIVFTEATAVVPEGRISPGDLGLWSDAHTAALAPIVQFIKSQGAVPGIQLAHAGRKASVSAPWQGSKPVLPEDGGWTPVAPSALPWAPGWWVPQALSLAEIARVPEAFAQAARRADAAGFEVVELHAAHGYLLHQFLSPLSNQRTDAYGGSLENRERLLLETFEALRAAWPAHKPLFVRLSCTDWVEGGWTLEDTLHLAAELKRRGVDALDCSSGGTSPAQQISLGPGYQVPFSTRIRAEVGIPTVAVGLLTEPLQCETLLVQGACDAVALARELLRDPHWPLRASRALQAEVVWPVQYERAR
jgi:2,4-dienoyl-CoA reductase-like NADH-dependent reductase (Old Yellow Enzyme family)